MHRSMQCRQPNIAYIVRSNPQARNLLQRSRPGFVESRRRADRTLEQQCGPAIARWYRSAATCHLKRVHMRL